MGCIRMIATVLTVALMCRGGGSRKAAVYEVGWTNVVGVDYDKWTADKKFEVGDVVVFNYDSRLHNVKRVAQHAFETCNATAALATYQTGSDFISLDEPGHLYFLCGYPGHCQAGQKIRIFVEANTPVAGAPTTVVPPPPPPLGPAASSAGLASCLWFCSFAFSLFVCFISASF